MQAKYINPFLAASIHVLEALIAVRPSIEGLRMGRLAWADDHIWLKIGVFGQMTGDIVFGFPKAVALRIVSAMMGGYAVTEFDEMSRSAIGELGNMISGNASTMLYDQGVHIDITPPRLVTEADESRASEEQNVFSVPIGIESIGKFHIYIIV